MHCIVHGVTKSWTQLSDFHFHSFILGFPSGSMVKDMSANTGDSSSIPRLRRSLGEGNGNPLQCSCLENPHGRRSLVSYSPWGDKASDTTEGLSTTQPPLLHSDLSPLYDTTPC